MIDADSSVSLVSIGQEVFSHHPGHANPSPYVRRDVGVFFPKRGLRATKCQDQVYCLRQGVNGWLSASQPPTSSRGIGTAHRPRRTISDAYLQPTVSARMRVPRASEHVNHRVDTRVLSSLISTSR